MATSSGPKKVRTDKTAEIKPDKYDSKPRGAPDNPRTTKRLPLPTGPADNDKADGGIPKGVVNPGSKEANEGTRKGSRY
jgi:hypothetical protein